MHIEPGAKVRTKDGHQAGQVRQAIWDPRGDKITEYVVTTGGLLGHDVIVSPELLGGATRDGGELVLALTKPELDQLARYEAHEYTTPPADWRAPTVSTFPAGGYLWPVTESGVAPVEATPPSQGQSRGPKITKGT